eukprot:1065239-Alexandrium_andersonii.AAC.1
MVCAGCQASLFGGTQADPLHARMIVFVACRAWFGGGFGGDALFLQAHGKSGETAKYGISFIAQTLPAIVILENVPGLVKGYRMRDAVTHELIVNVASNLYVLLSERTKLGYICPVKIVGPKPFMDASRNRAYLPCVRLPS